MGKTWRIANVLGIPILIHWTMGLFFLFFVWFCYMESMPIETALLYFGFICCLFLCILMHEFGHTQTAKRYGVNTQDIILSPLGGLARLENMPKNPIQEFKIALNGPMVNLTISLILAIALYFINGQVIPTDLSFNSLVIDRDSFLPLLMIMNLGVFLFNLIPAFPMDGGRILRSLLSIKIGKLRATFWASLLGKGFAIGFLFYAIYSNQLILGLIGFFIYFMAGQEYKQVKVNEKMERSSLKEIMEINFQKVFSDELISSFLERIPAGGKNNFLVFDPEGRRVVGTLPHLFIEEIKKEPQKYQKVEDLMSTKYLTLGLGDTVSTAYREMKDLGLAIIGITNDLGELVGVVDRPEILSFISDRSK